MRISVVIPTYDRGPLLDAALDSVLGQTLLPDEVLVVDDGSTDDTALRVRRREAPVRLLTQGNAGPSAARNRGIREANGDWIAFLDSDDLWEPTKLERQAAAARSDPAASLVYCDSRPVDLDGRPLSGHTKPVHEGQVTCALFQSIFVHTPAVMVKSDLVRELGGFDTELRVCEDYDLWLRASLETPFALVDAPLFLRRVHAASLAHEDDPTHHDQKALVLERFLEDPRARELVPESVRRRRLARVRLKAARSHWRHGHRQVASDHLRRSLEMAPWSPAAWWLKARTALSGEDAS